MEIAKGREKTDRFGQGKRINVFVVLLSVRNLAITQNKMLVECTTSKANSWQGNERGRWRFQGKFQKLLKTFVYFQIDLHGLSYCRLSIESRRKILWEFPSRHFYPNSKNVLYYVQFVYILNIWGIIQSKSVDTWTKLDYMINYEWILRKYLYIFSWLSLEFEESQIIELLKDLQSHHLNYHHFNDSIRFLCE